MNNLVGVSDDSMFIMGWVNRPYLGFHSPYAEQIGFSGLCVLRNTDPYNGKPYFNYVDGRVVGQFTIKKLK